MHYRTLLYLVLVLYGLAAWLIIRIVMKKKSGETLYESIVYYIFQAGCTFTLAFFFLLVTLKVLYANLPLVNYESMKIIVVGMLITALSLAALSYINYRTLKRIGRKK
ncbi:MAG TPA: hypothetical protein ENL15_03550 [Firmicutes bacterium]|nr:hypothetical protein [Bacillota bacterium]